MNTYILPLSDSDSVWVEPIHAVDYNNAREKFMKELGEDYDLPVCVDWKDFTDELRNLNIEIGDIYDVDEF